MRVLAAAATAALVMAAGAQKPPAQVIDPAQSKLTVYVYKQGLFSFLADNHVIDAPIQRLSYDAQRGSVEVIIDAQKLRVLDPRLAADKRATVQSNMLGPKVLDVAKYPTITFESTNVQPNGAGLLKLTGNLQLHGQTHAIVFQAKDNGGGHFTGSAVVRQTAFGITPIKIAGGAVSVKDDVRVDFDIVILPRAL